jgi:hypothetical protein
MKDKPKNYCFYIGNYPYESKVLQFKNGYFFSQQKLGDFSLMEEMPDSFSFMNSINDNLNQMSVKKTTKTKSRD